ncbi:GDP-mannose-dependent alpha-(1-2)-phosphatidylinositol mannosyltransferase [mine drainage metagenome]|uniref:GDP-mannose-dependent alpha-(1-2)-phosphatidylinositol mannosyltransferase n=1 Tax=mine drainage metagenome TaxID=410659 RepID=A0A1J5TMC4_9ZZZZ
MAESGDLAKVAFLGDYLPRKCGIATFTTDLRCAIATAFPELQCPVVPVNDTEDGYDYPPEVRFEVAEQDLPSYLRAADFLNITDVDVLCVEHEFGIFGGPAGSHVLALLRELRMPIVTTLHTVLNEPNAEQRRVMRELTRLSTRLVVMTGRGHDFLRNIYGVPEAKIDVIPHGIPDMPFADPNYFKDEFAVAGKQVLLTFGLLSPNKGIEYALRALPEIIRQFPGVVYIVLGQTHPNLLRNEGEAYRLSLERLAKELGVQKHVVFFNRFVELEELMRFIGAADIYLTPYLTETQITSGTLAYAFGAGNAVISTPYWHAAELLAQDRGRLVPFRDSAAIAEATIALLRDEPARHALRRNAYKLGREMVWSRVAQLYVNSFEQARRDHSFVGTKSSPIKTLDEQPGQLPEMKLDHLYRMSDSTGIFQHASFTVPNFAEGYCTDDNARALVLALMLQRLGKSSPQLQAHATTFAAFLNHAFDRQRGRFRNFMSFDRHWLEDVGSEDCQGHALWALGLCVAQAGQGNLQLLAAQLFELALPAAAGFTSPRAWAFALIGIDEYLRRLSGDRRVTQFRDTLTSKLLQRYADAGTPEWEWFEEVVSYANAKLPHAMILSGRCMNNAPMLELGLKTLRWLVKVQTSPAGSFRPVGSDGFYPRGRERALFDQQPIEAQATVSACIEAYHATNDPAWLAEARRAFEWFLGRNDLGLALYDPSTGGCRDGLHVDRLSQNQGGESTLAFLLALAEMQALQNTITSFTEPVGK